MQKLKRLAAMTNPERSLLLRALFIVGVTRVALHILSAANAQRVAFRLTRVSRTPFASLDKFVWAVKAASRCVPHATCLTQAIAAHALLASGGYRSRVAIGVTKNDGQFEAHAWLTCEGQVMLGGPETTRFVLIAAWER